MTSVLQHGSGAGVLTRVVLNQADIDRALTRIAHEILEANKGSQDLVLLGIPRRGYPLAVRLAPKIAAADPTVDAAAIVGQLDVTMFRDDLSHQPTRPPYPTQLPRTGIDNKVVVLIDDVLYSGRTIRAALDAIIWRSLFGVTEQGEEPLEGEAFRDAIMELVTFLDPGVRGRRAQAHGLRGPALVRTRRRWTS